MVKAKTAPSQATNEGPLLTKEAVII